MAWPSTWTDRRDRDRTPSIPGHELAGVVTALGYGTTSHNRARCGFIDVRYVPELGHNLSSQACPLDARAPAQER
jgi:hypothetical protein